MLSNMSKTKKPAWDHAICNQRPGGKAWSEAAAASNIPIHHLLNFHCSHHIQSFSEPYRFYFLKYWCIGEYWASFLHYCYHYFTLASHYLHLQICSLPNLSLLIYVPPI